ncbi:MAG: MarR family transcriptional regulator [Actinomycetota bacterium]
MTERAGLIQQVRVALRTVSPSLGRLNNVVGSRVDLIGTDIEVLDHIGRIGPVSPGDLAESLRIHPATMTGILDRLEEGGWVVRERSAQDRRRVHLKALRTRGPELVRLYAPMNKAIENVCAGLSDDQLRTVIEFLGSVSDAAREAAADVDLRTQR